MEERYKSFRNTLLHLNYSDSVDNIWRLQWLWLKNHYFFHPEKFINRPKKPTEELGEPKLEEIKDGIEPTYLAT